jgi:nucleoside-diphosphate-sugar epimerase
MTNGLVAVTGATGFIGQALCARLVADGRPVLALVRDAQRARSLLPKQGIEISQFGDEGLAGREVLGRANAVVHLAARAHVLKETEADPQTAFVRANRDLTLRLARDAAAAGVQRFVFVSTIGVNGRKTCGEPFVETARPAPHDAYSMAKWEAEQGLGRIGADTGLELVVLRPPLVYGPGVKANFRRIIDLTASGIPLPFGSIANRRSFVFVGNLVDAIVRCVDHPAAKGQTFLVSDGEDLSTPELIRRLAGAMGRRARLFPFPPALLRAGASLLGRGSEAARLIESLQVDSGKIRDLLGWRPPHTVAWGLRLAAESHRAGRTP